MRILAIDPGNVESGYCILDSETLRPLEFGKVPNAELERGLYLQYKVGHVVIEMIASYGMPVGREVFETCVEIGRLTVLAELREIRTSYVFRKDEKLAICGSPKANDGTIRRALIDRFAEHDLRAGKGTKKKPDWFFGFKADVWAAYAVGVTWADKEAGRW